MHEVIKPADTVQYLYQLREAIPFLRGIPDKIYFGLDTFEFYLPVGEIAQTRHSLEETIGSFVMTYNRDVFNLEIPAARHLCANLKGAELTTEQFALLRQYEGMYVENRVSFVVYQKPLVLTPPQNSALELFYREKALFAR